MAKIKPKTRIMIGGLDVSNSVLVASLSRFPADVESIDLRLCVDRIEVEEDRTLVIHVLEDL